LRIHDQPAIEAAMRCYDQRHIPEEGNRGANRKLLEKEDLIDGGVGDASPIVEILDSVVSGSTSKEVLRVKPRG
jgi:hypothetical protein